MKNSLKILSFVVVLFMGYGCTDLDEDLQGQFTEESTINNPNLGASVNVNGSIPNDGLGGAFNVLLNGTANHGGYFAVTEISTDEAVVTQKGGDWFDGGIWINMHRHDFRDTNDGLNGSWAQLYDGVTQCNILLGDATVNSNANNVAQLLTLRAYFFWRLMDMFGRIKLVVESGVDVPQTERIDAFNQIESDLLAAIPDLSTGRQQYGRINAYGAYALLARLYLNAEVYTGTARYQDAIDAADEVINSGIYDLGSSYEEVFGPANVDNIEHIFVVPFDEATGQGGNFSQMTLHYGSQLTYRLKEQPWNGYSTLEEFYNSYSDNDLRKDAFFLEGPQSDAFGDPVVDIAFDQADEDGAELNFTPAINELAPNGSRQAGARMAKFSFKIGQAQHMDNDFPLLRYGDVLLMKAEATARLNGDNFSDATTLMLVNQIRDRAGLNAVTGLTADEFLAERGREMFQELIRRTDLIRFGAWGNAWWEKPAHSDAFKNIMPIPLDQINASATSQFQLTQNPGY